jgi:hypothetical protein
VATTDCLPLTVGFTRGCRRRPATLSSANAAIEQIADVMRRANDAGALQRVPELLWIQVPADPRPLGVDVYEVTDAEEVRRVR